MNLASGGYPINSMKFYFMATFWEPCYDCDCLGSSGVIYENNSFFEGDYVVSGLGLGKDCLDSLALASY